MKCKLFYYVKFVMNGLAIVYWELLFKMKNTSKIMIRIKTNDMIKPSEFVRVSFK